MSTIFWIPNRKISTRNFAGWCTKQGWRETSTFYKRASTTQTLQHCLKAHEILRKGLQQFLEFKEADLETYLTHVIESDSITFKDEYGQDIRSYYKVFRFIWVQYSET